MADTEMETLDRMRWKATVIVAGLVAIPLIFTLVLVAIANGSD